MAHFAQIQDGTVVSVIVVANSTLNDAPFPESEALGQTFMASIGLAGNWLQTSYSASFRGIYAGIGFTYDANLDVFVAPPTPEADDDSVA